MADEVIPAIGSQPSITVEQHATTSKYGGAFSFISFGRHPLRMLMRPPLVACSFIHFFDTEVQTAGIAFQLRPNRHLQLKLSSATIDQGQCIYYIILCYIILYYIILYNFHHS